MKNSSIALVFLFLLSTCYHKEDPMSNTTGFLNIGIDISLTIKEEGGRTGAVNTDNFKVCIYTATHVEIISYKASDLPSQIELPVGEYYVTANSNDLVPAAFDAPFYAGKSTVFKINMEETKQVTVHCALANCMLTIDYSNNIKEKFSTYSSDVSFAGGSLSFTRNEGRTAYFDLVPLSLSSRLEYDGGENIVVKTVTGQIPDPKPKTFYKILIDATLNNGQVDFNLSVDEEVETVDLTFGESSGEPPVQTIGINEVEYGNLIITEIMFDPQALADAQGEWVEIYNTTPKRINLKGLRLLDNSPTSTITINQDIFLSPSSYFVIAKTASAVENPDFISSSLNLANTGELLKLVAPSELEIAWVDYALIIQAMSTPAGSSLNLSRNKYTADEAKLPQSWCLGTEIYHTGDKGTPGKANLICP
jgi:hypothetical protein